MATQPLATPATSPGMLPTLLTSPFKYGSVTAGVLLLVKAYGVGHYSLTNTGALITTAPVTAILGTLASYEYLMWPLLAVGLLWWLLASATTYSQRIVALVLAVVAALLSPLSYLLPVLGLGATVYLLAWAAEKRADAARRHLLPFFVLATAGTFLVATLDKPWVPAEVLVLKQPVLVKPLGNVRDQYPTVYVLDAGGGTVTAMVAGDRYILRIPADRVEGRLTCHLDGQLAGQAPLLLRLQHRAYSSPNLSCARLTDHLKTGQTTP